MTDLTPARKLLNILTEKVEAVKTVAEYTSRLWRACERLFLSGNDGNFIASVIRTVDQQLTKAWYEGAEAVGVMPEDMTADDMQILTTIIDNEAEYVYGLSSDILAARAAEMTSEEFAAKFVGRIEIWAGRYPETQSRAKMHFGGKTRLIWQLGATEKHCVTCSQLNGIIAFAEEWEQSGVQPQAPPNAALECGGWRCDCSLNPTDKRRSPNALTRILDAATARNL